MSHTKIPVNYFDSYPVRQIVALLGHRAENWHLKLLIHCDASNNQTRCLEGYTPVQILRICGASPRSAGNRAYAQRAVEHMLRSHILHDFQGILFVAPPGNPDQTMRSKKAHNAAQARWIKLKRPAIPVPEKGGSEGIQAYAQTVINDMHPLPPRPPITQQVSSQDLFVFNNHTLSSVVSTCEKDSSENKFGKNVKIDFDAAAPDLVKGLLRLEANTDFRRRFDELLSVWKRTYPALNLDAEFREANHWLVTNPKGKSYSNVVRFVGNWLKTSEKKRIDSEKKGYLTSGSQRRLEPNSARYIPGKYQSVSG